MADLTVQASFNSGEWAPSLFARVDIQKYKSGAAVLENFYVDYRGGASTRPGSMYVLQAYKSSTAVRLITFQASFNTGYVLEFGNQYIRFYFNGAPIVETGLAVTAITRTAAATVTVTNTYAVGDWVYITGVVGMVQINGRYFSVLSQTGTTIHIGDLNGVAINSTAYNAYVSGGTVQRVYTIATPYAAADLETLKFAQVTNTMILCHPSYPAQVLTLNSATNWTLAAVAYGSTAVAPTNVSVTSTLGSGSVGYSYVVTSISGNGQESEPSAAGSLTGKADIRAVAGSNQITWTPAAGAVAYNVYESVVSYFGVVPPGVSYGFIGTVKNTTFIDSNIGADFSESPPVAQDPFVGNGIAFATVTTAGTYTTVPTISLTGGSPAIAAQLIASLGIIAAPTIGSGGSGYVVGDTVNLGNGVVMTVTTAPSAAITAWTVAAHGSVTSGTTPSNPLHQVTTSGIGTGATGTATWGVEDIFVQVAGAGYNAVPTLAFSAGSAAATAALSGPSVGNPAVPSFFQQRLVLAAPSGAPQSFYMSQPGNYYNFDITDPAAAGNAITGTLVSKSAQIIKSLVSSAAGMLVFTDGGTWLVNGGSSGSAVSPEAIVANAQSSVGANDVPPIVSNYDVLFVQAKGSAVRDLAYNIYVNTFSGTDISITSSHLFYGYSITEWAWAEQPFYVVWAVRNDGVMLTLTYLKEQDFVGWTHQVTAGQYRSVTAVTEATSDAGNVDAIYTVVSRSVNGNAVKYIERIADRAFPNGLSSAWCVDSGSQYSGAAALTFYGAEHLAALTVTGLQTDDQGNTSIITPFTMPTTGQFTLPTPIGPATGYVTVTLGIAFTCKLQTLALDIAQAPIQGKLKKVPYVDVRVNQSLGLTIGQDFDHQVPMKDLMDGTVSSMATGLEAPQTVVGLYSGDARTYLGPSFNIYGQYCIEQTNPYPATVLGVFPCLTLGDDA